MDNKEELNKDEVLSFDQKLESEILEMEKSREQLQAQYNSISGALSFAKGMLKEYKQGNDGE